jgi:hypothetical protein
MMKNAFEEANHAHCFNHMLQLSAKTLLKPFNVGMSSTNSASEEDLEEHNEVQTLLDQDAISIDEADDILLGLLPPPLGKGLCLPLLPPLPLLRPPSLSVPLPLWRNSVSRPFKTAGTSTRTG